MNLIPISNANICSLCFDDLYFSLHLCIHAIDPENMKQFSIFYHSTLLVLLYAWNTFDLSICCTNTILRHLAAPRNMLHCSVLLFFLFGHMLANVKRCIMFLLLVVILTLNADLTHCEGHVDIYQANQVAYRTKNTSQSNFLFLSS